MPFFEMFGAISIFILILMFLVAIAPLFIWIHVRAIRFMLEHELRAREEWRARNR